MAWEPSDFIDDIPDLSDLGAFQPLLDSDDLGFPDDGTDFMQMIEMQLRDPDINADPLSQWFDRMFITDDDWLMDEASSSILDAEQRMNREISEADRIVEENVRKLEEVVESLGSSEWQGFLPPAGSSVENPGVNRHLLNMNLQQRNVASPQVLGPLSGHQDHSEQVARFNAAVSEMRSICPVEEFPTSLVWTEQELAERGLSGAPVWNI